MTAQTGLHLMPATQTIRDGWVHVESRIVRGDPASDQGQTIFVAFPEKFAGMVNLNAHIFLPACMVYGMQQNVGQVHTHHQIDPRTQYGLEEIQRAYFSLYPKKLNRIEIVYGQSLVRTPEASQPRGRGVFFSAGVDAFHAAMTVSQDPLLVPAAGSKGYLIAIQGFDTMLDENELFGQILNAANHVAEKTGWEVIPMRTNLKQVLYPESNRHRGWAEFGYVSCMMAAANALSLGIERAYIASGMGYMDTTHDGSSPAYDHLWSSSAVELVNIGSYATRMMKLEAMHSWKELLKYLKVCGQRKVINPVNCGWCDKCKRTILALHAVGLLEYAREAFHPATTTNLVATAEHVNIPSDFQRLLYRQILERLEQRPEDAAIANALRQSIEVSLSPWRMKMREKRRRLDYYWHKGWKRLRGGFRSSP